MGRDYTLRLPAGDHALHEASRKAISDLPMGRRKGDKFKVHGHLGEFKVIRVRGNQCLCTDENLQCWLELGQKLYKLEDHQRCPHCGGWICSCHDTKIQGPEISSEQTDTNPEHRHPKQPMKPMTFTELASRRNEDKIPCVEGKLVKLWPANKGIAKKGKNAGKPYSLQNGTIEEEGTGLQHDVTFAAPENEQPQERRGQFIRISCHEGAKGESGIYMQEQEYPPDSGTIQRKVWVTKSAHITYDTAEGDAPPASHGAVSEDRSRQSTERGPQLTFLKASMDHFDFLERVGAMHDQRLADGKLKPLTGDGIQAAAFTIYMRLLKNENFKSEWLGSGTSEKALSEASDAPWGSDDPPAAATPEKALPVQKKAPPAEAVKTWKDECHPNGTKFGEAPKSDLQRWCLWAFALQALKGKDAKGKEIGIEPKRMMTSMLTCAVENKWTAQSLLIARLAKTDECQAGKFDDDDIEAYFKEHEVMDIISSDKKEMDDNVASAVEDLITLHQQRSAGQSTEEVQIPE